jgi:hypothetical protein
MTFAERMKKLSEKVEDAAQDFASKAGDTAQDLSIKGVQASKDFLGKLGDKAHDLGSSALQASKELINKAGDKAQDLGEKGKLLLEVKQLESKAQKLIAQLGAEVYETLAEQKLASVNQETPVIKEIFEQLDVIQKEIDKKEAEIKTK